MTTTQVGITAGEPRAHVDLVVGALAPRLVRRSGRAAEVVLTAAGMILLGGDRVDIRIRVGPGCTLDLVEAGGTVAYPATGAPSDWRVDVTVGAGGLLRWQGLPFVVAGGADVARRTSIVLGEHSRALVRETLVLGRHGEHGGRLVSTFEASDADGPLLCESLEVDGRAGEPGVLGGSRVLDTVTALGFRPPAAPGDLVLAGCGALARRLTAAAHESTLGATWASWAAASTRRDQTAVMASQSSESGVE